MAVGPSGPNSAMRTSSVIGNSAIGGSGTDIGNEGIGGGAYVVLFTPFSGATATFTNCNFVQDVALGGSGRFGLDGEGGGMFVSGETTMALNGCNFTQCVAQVRTRR